jgi:glyoxylase-like metal-dependent hydrolase (beta-lactamase superfamily II)
MEIQNISVGELQTNCYLVWNEDTRNCLIIDPGEDADFISEEILRLNLHPQAILLTHGHFDHCLACLELKLNFNLPIYLDPKDAFLYQNSSRSAEHFTSSKALKQPSTLPYPKEIKLDNVIFKVIPIPGHTPGSICLYSAPHLFVGDTVFENGVGRTDFSYSSAGNLKKSLAKILSYPPETLIYPGHENTPVFLSEINFFQD